MSVIPFPRQTARDVEIWELPSGRWIVSIAGDEHEVLTHSDALSFAAGVVAVTRMRVVDWAAPQPLGDRG